MSNLRRFRKKSNMRWQIRRPKKGSPLFHTHTQTKNISLFSTLQNFMIFLKEGIMSKRSNSPGLICLWWYFYFQQIGEQLSYYDWQNRSCTETCYLENLNFPGGKKRWEYNRVLGSGKKKEHTTAMLTVLGMDNPTPPTPAPPRCMYLWCSFCFCQRTVRQGNSRSWIMIMKHQECVEFWEF